MQITEDVHHHNSLVNTATSRLKDPLLSEGEKGELRAQLVSYSELVNYGCTTVVYSY